MNLGEIQKLSGQNVPFYDFQKPLCPATLMLPEKVM